MAREMFLQFYPGEQRSAEGFKSTVAQILAETDLCMADLQQHFISHRKNTANVAAEQNQIKKGLTGEQLKHMTDRLTTAEKEKDKDKDEKTEGKENEDTKSNSKENYLANALIAIAVGVGVGVGVGLLGSRTKLM